jgi:hypothetical protein
VGIELAFVITLIVCIVLLRRVLNNVTHSDTAMYVSFGNYSVVVTNMRHQDATELARNIEANLNVKIHSVLVCDASGEEIDVQMELNECAKYLQFAKDCKQTPSLSKLSSHRLHHIISTDYEIRESDFLMDNKDNNEKSKFIDDCLKKVMRWLDWKRDESLYFFSSFLCLFFYSLCDFRNSAPRASNCSCANYPEICMCPFIPVNNGFDVQTVMRFEHLVKIFHFIPILPNGERMDLLCNSDPSESASIRTQLYPYPSTFPRTFCRGLCGFPFRPDSHALPGTLHMLLSGAGKGAGVDMGGDTECQKVNADVRQFVLKTLFSPDSLMAGLEAVLLRQLLPMDTKDVCECVFVLFAVNAMLEQISYGHCCIFFNFILIFNLIFIYTCYSGYTQHTRLGAWTADYNSSEIEYLREISDEVARKYG